jgi:hypothetical protein
MGFLPDFLRFSGANEAPKGELYPFWGWRAEIRRKPRFAQLNPHKPQKCVLCDCHSTRQPFGLAPWEEKK